VPFLPYIFDHPVDEAVDWVFHTGLRLYAGEDAVRSLPRPSEVVSTAKDQEEDSTSLSHFHIKAPNRESPAVSGNPTWDEYRDQRQRAKEQRKREREERGERGVLATLGFGGSSSGKKDKTE
jgi:fission process protein 1